ncbi:hypothetical protein MBLNU230_g7766t1 [Neophaeotheca triangularis]
MPTNQGAYGATAGNDTTGFRKTWDREEYAAKAAETAAKEREEGKARYEAKLAGKKYHARASTPPDAKFTEARRARINVADRIGTSELVAAGGGQGKRGQSAGFYCKSCDLTFKDNLQLVEHENSKQHLVAIGETGEVQIASLEEVKARFWWLVEKREKERELENVGLEERLGLTQEAIDEERAEKRRRRNEKRRKTKDGLGLEPIERGVKAEE